MTSATFRFQNIFYIIGLFLLSLGAIMIVPALIDILTDNKDWKSFFIGSISTTFVGGLLVLANHSHNENFPPLNVKQMFLLTTFCWVFAGAFSSIPFYFSSLNLSIVDSFFESMSGITTTGATIITDLSMASKSILFWRALLQAIGGIGIVVIAVLILPFLKVGGFQLFRTESSEHSEKIFPRIGQIAASILTIYVVFIIICAIALWQAGMSGFDAIIHSMSTISIGGFSSYNESIAHFNSATIEWILIFAMIASGLPLLYYINLINGLGGNFYRLLKSDSQVKMFLLFLLFLIISITFIFYNKQNITFLESLRLVSFNVVSIVTTTGFSSADYGLWGNLFVVLFFCLFFIGGCTGSTSGSFKIFRWQVLVKMLREQILSTFQPHRVSSIKHNGKPISNDVLFSITNFLFLYIGILFISAIILAGFGLDFITAISAAASAITNVGPGLGNIIGPSGNYSSLPDGAKAFLSFIMVLGRLEILTVLVLFLPSFWRK